MWLLKSPFIVARLCLVSRVLRFLPVSLTNVSVLAVAAFDLVYCSLSVLRFTFVLDNSNKSSYSGYRFVCNAFVVRL